MCNGIIIRNTLDLYAIVCSESANVPVNGWIGGPAGGRVVSGPSSVSGSSLRARSRANSAIKESGVSASIRLDWSRINCGARHGTAAQPIPQKCHTPLRLKRAFLLFVHFSLPYPPPLPPLFSTFLGGEVDLLIASKSPHAIDSPEGKQRRTQNMAPTSKVVC